MSSPSARRDSNSIETPADRRARALLRAALARLQDAGVDDPLLNAEWLLARVLGEDRLTLYENPDDVLPEDKAAEFVRLIARRAKREPLQHILGETEFWSLTIHCDRRALIPRPETELLVEVAVKTLKLRATPAIAEIGTGTGCISIALAKELPRAKLYASDVSRDALALAEENLRLHRMEDRIRLLQGSLCAPFLKAGLAGQLDLVVSNPPYIADSEFPSLQPEVRDHDPRAALSGGKDGLHVMRRLVKETPALLRQNGWLLVEIGAGQAEKVGDLLSRTGVWRKVETFRDLAKIERAVAAQKAFSAGSETAG